MLNSPPTFNKGVWNNSWAGMRGAIIWLESIKVILFLPNSTVILLDSTYHIFHGRWLLFSGPRMNHHLSKWFMVVSSPLPLIILGLACNRSGQWVVPEEKETLLDVIWKKFSTLIKNSFSGLRCYHENGIQSICNQEKSWPDDNKSRNMEKTFIHIWI